MKFASTGIWQAEHEGWPRDSWIKLSQGLVAGNEGWQIWIDWYQARLDGTPSLDLDRAIALIDPEIWDAGPAVANAEVARLVAEFAGARRTASSAHALSLQALLGAKDLRAALADFELDDMAHLMRMVQFVEDLKDLDNPTVAQDRANRLSELRDLMTDLARDIRDFASDNAPKYVARAASRYGNEAKLPVNDVRPGRLWDLGLELAGALKDREVEGALPDHLFEKLDHAVTKHRDLMREYFASVLARMRPLDQIEVAPEASPEDAIEALVQANDGIENGDWETRPVLTRKSQRFWTTGSMNCAISWNASAGRPTMQGRQHWKKPSGARRSLPLSPSCATASRWRSFRDGPSERLPASKRCYRYSMRQRWNCCRRSSSVSPGSHEKKTPAA